MDRFFLAPDEWGDEPALSGAEAHHCSRVMRKRSGDRVIIFDGCGREGEAVLGEVSKSSVGLEILSRRESKVLSPQIEIAVGIPKGKSFDLILQKAVELGVHRIQPLVSDQGNVRFKAEEAEEAEAKREKWQRAVLEACKQCGQNFLPEVEVPLELGQYLTSLDEGTEGARFVGALTEETKSLRSLLSEMDSPARVCLIIGPEGDFSSAEYEEIFSAGYAPVSLGELVLRTETAVFWMMSAVRYQFQL